MIKLETQKFHLQKRKSLMTSIEGMALNLVSLMNDSFQEKEGQFVSATVESCFKDTAVIEIVTANQIETGEQSETFVVMMSKAR